MLEVRCKSFSLFIDSFCYIIGLILILFRISIILLYESLTWNIVAIFIITSKSIISLTIKVVA
jgi:hypothetical protein